MAAPYVSGNLALIKEANPTYSNVNLRQELQKTVLDLGTVGKDTSFGFGLIQAPRQKSITSVSTDQNTYVAGDLITIKVRVTEESSHANYTSSQALTSFFFTR